MSKDPNEQMASMLRQIRGLLPATDEFMSMELPFAVQRYVNQLGCRASDPVAAAATVKDLETDQYNKAWSHVLRILNEEYEEPEKGVRV